MTTDILGSQGPNAYLNGFCERCNRHFLVSIPVLAERLGPEVPVIEAMKRVTCKDCGGKVQMRRGFLPKVT